LEIKPLFFSKRISRKLKDKGGYGFPLTIAIILSLLIIVAGVSEYLRLKIIISGVKEGVQNAVIAVSIENYDNNFSPLREGYSAGYKKQVDEWEERINDGDVWNKLSSLLDLEIQGSKYVKTSGNQIEYKLSSLSVNIINSDFAPGSNSKVFEAETYLRVEVPLSFGWESLPPLDINLKVKSKYMAKF